MSQFFQGVTAGSLPPSVPTQFTTDDMNTAIPVGNNINIFTPGNGTDGIITSSSGDTITITLTGTLPNYVNVVGVPLGTTYVVTADDYFISCDSSGGLVTIQLPNSPGIYEAYVVKDRTGNASVAFPITVTTPGGLVNIDGTPTYLFTDAYESQEFLFNGTSYETF